ncbi:MAG: hypothetical protein LBU22_06810 [Dysgonamonadaceae bacterium]|jgi:hypothetical protein|nr:hypothetical protein [Dysgonamonadaceae bacterium]
MSELNKLIVSEINKNLPSDKKMIKYLMDILDIGRESAYRRIKNQIPFTVEEAAIVAKDLKFSLDMIIGADIINKENFPEKLNITIKESYNNFQDQLKFTNLFMQQIGQAKELSIISALNYLPMHFFPYEALFKFEYCRTLHSVGEISFSSNFTDMKITPELMALHKESVLYFNQLRNITCIVDESVFEKLVKEIQYYYNREFITDEDIRLLQEDLFGLLSFVEKVLTGVSHNDHNYSIYLSSFALDSNCAYYEFDDNVISQIWLFPYSPVMINNNHIVSEMQKKWLESRIKYSTLLSKSNDMLQFEILRKAHQLITNMYPQAD